MITEFEAVFSPVDKEEMREKIKSIWGKCTKVNTLMKRVVFENPINPHHSYLRVRDEWWKITCCMKTVDTWNLHIWSVKELETQVDDFDTMKNMFMWLGLKRKAYQETYREIWEIAREIEIMIDEWPGLRPFIEIEWANEEQVKKYAELLGCDYSEAIFWTVDQIYKKELWFERNIQTLSLKLALKKYRKDSFI
jgi:adenylate cyclase class 2